MKKYICLLSAFLLLAVSAAASQKNGDAIGNVLYSDICAYINGYPINSYNIDGNTAIIAKDLDEYGFDVSWDSENRVTVIDLNTEKTVAPQQQVYKNAKRAGALRTHYLFTDITAMIGGKTSVCYNIDHRTVIKLDDLSCFGNVEWDSKNRTISLVVPGASQGEYAKIEDNPNVVTMYASDGRTITVGSDEADAYRAVNWYDSISEVTRTLFAKDGRTLDVFVDEVPVYLGLGWYRSDPNKKMIALTFDDGPSQYTSLILDQLEKYGAKATFFVVGNRISGYKSIVKRQSDLGMEIGNHSYDHPQLTKLSRSDLVHQKNSTNDAVKNITGQSPTLLRPPYGSTNQTVSSVFDMPVILWSVDTLDWKTRDAQKTINHVLNNIKDGDIVLMHDIYKASADAAVQLIPKLIEKGYSLVTVSELGKAKLGKLENTKSYTRIK